MSKAQRLFGTVTAIDTAWSDEYQNITVTIQVRRHWPSSPSSAIASAAKARTSWPWATRSPCSAR